MCSKGFYSASKKVIEVGLKGRENVCKYVKGTMEKPFSTRIPTPPPSGGASGARIGNVAPVGQSPATRSIRCTLHVCCIISVRAQVIYTVIVIAHSEMCISAIDNCAQCRKLV